MQVQICKSLYYAKFAVPQFCPYPFKKTVNGHSVQTHKNWYQIP